MTETSPKVIMDFGLWNDLLVSMLGKFVYGALRVCTNRRDTEYMNNNGRTGECMGYGLAEVHTSNQTRTVYRCIFICNVYKHGGRANTVSEAWNASSAARYSRA